MTANRNEQRLLESIWVRIRPLLSVHPIHTRGGRPFVDDFCCFCGIVYQLRIAIRWNDMPAEYPSGVICWRRFDARSRAGLWPCIHKIIVEELQAADLLDLDELAIYATFGEA